jgi:hypothetical protein
LVLFFEEPQSQPTFHFSRKNNKQKHLRIQPGGMASCLSTEKSRELLNTMGRELTCPVCLSIAKPPIARLQCCHYFCMCVMIL